MFAILEDRFDPSGRFASRIIGVTLVLALAPAAAWAGPPLLCHPFEIGSARSLPWDGSTSWWQGSRDYDLSRLVGDTEALLTPATPVIARMETLRRAAIYASRDEDVARRLLDRVMARARAAEPDALALLDAGYLVETLRQIGSLGQMPVFRAHAQALGRLVENVDGYAMVKKSLERRPGESSLEFAAALVTAGRDAAAFAAHSRRAKAGLNRDPLLARNIHQLG